MVGDYLLQNSWMGLRKKQAWGPCMAHCLIWTACVALMGGFGPVAAAWLFVCHYAQDRTQFVLRFMVWKDGGDHTFVEQPFGPWSIIVVDNSFHLLQIWFAWRFLPL